MTDGLATRCPACETVFRVVPDQLRVSDGWVRCGRCAEVFNAGRALVDVSSGAARAPDPTTPPVPADAEIGPDEATAAPAPAPAPAPRARADDASTPESPFERTAVLHPQTSDPGGAGAGTRAGAEMRSFDVEAMIDRSSVAPVPAPVPAPVSAPGSDDVPHDVARAASQESAPDSELDFALDTVPDPAALDSVPPLPVDDAQRFDRTEEADGRDPTFAPSSTYGGAPSFVRRAERAARWRQPGVRMALSGAVLLGLLLLAAQVAHAYRDLVAARFPATRPALEMACAGMGCTVGTARSIDGFTVESSGLLRVAQTDGYRLSVALRNRAGIDLTLPAVDLMLTDSQGRLLARRVLRTDELGAAQATLAAGVELSLQATLRIVGEPVAGYTIDLFYP